MRNAGVHRATFGAGAKDSLEVIDNIKGIKAKLLSQVYQAIVSSFSLTNKSRYRYVSSFFFALSTLIYVYSEKFGTFEDDLYVCYPDGSMGLTGIEAILHSVRDPQGKKHKHKKRAGDPVPGPSSDAASNTASSSGSGSGGTGTNSTRRKLNEINESSEWPHPFSTAAGGD